MVLGYLQEQFQMTMHGPQVNTPPPMEDDGTPTQTGLASPPRSSPRRRAAAPRARLNRSPRERTRSRRSSSKSSANSPVVVPLSRSTAHLTHIPVKNMEVKVTRTPEQRHEEVERKGKVPRPMNSFMLYRDAYTDRIKAHMKQNNHQNISRIAGSSWQNETRDIRDYYEELARIERDSHANAHPEYKFKPQKGPAATRRVTESPSSVRSGHMTDRDSPFTWDNDFMSTTAAHGRTTSYDTSFMSSSRGSTPFDDPESFMDANGYYQSYPPSISLPTVHPSALHNMEPMGQALPFHRGSPAPQQMTYGLSTGLTGIPGGTHADLLQPQPGHLEGGNMDPQLLNYPGGVHSGYPTWDDINTPGSYLSTSAPVDSPTPTPMPFGHSQVGATYLPSMQRELTWDPSQHDSNAVSDDAWLNEGHVQA